MHTLAPRPIRLAACALLLAACGDTGKSSEQHLADDAADTSVETPELTKPEPEPATLCLQAEREPELIGAALGTTASGSILLENCGDAAVHLAALSIDASSIFSVVDAVTHVGAVLEPGQTHALALAYRPDALGEHRATLTVDYEGEGRAQALDVALHGVAVEEACPQLEALGQVVRRPNGVVDPAPAPPSDTIDTVSESAIRLTVDATRIMPGRTLEQLEWSIVEAPDGFAIDFHPSAQAPEVEIQLALVGQYVFEVRAVDSEGVESCAPARVTATAWPAGDLVIELVWQTPSDLDETDTCVGCGTDLDFHLLNGLPNAHWGDSTQNGTDCFFNNLNPNWGDLTSAADDPSMTRDDSDGGGPEVFVIEAPALSDRSDPDGYDAPYQVGAYFYDQWSYEPPVHAQVKIYTMRNLEPAAVWPTSDPQGRALAVSDPSLGRTGDFWLAGTIDWTTNGPVLTELDEITTGYPNESDGGSWPLP